MENTRDLGALEQTIGVQFKDKDLLRLAMVHGSYVNENPDLFPESNERLEFLGDAVIGLVIAHKLYLDHEGEPEGGLTAMRSALVRGETLAKVAGSMELGSYMLMGAGEDAGGGRQRPSNLAAAFEALVGAILLDSGYNTARSFVLMAMADELADVGGLRVTKSTKSVLQEVVQGRGLALPVYRIVESAGPEHEMTFTAEVLVSDKVMGRGTGGRKSAAEQEAASEALKILGHEP